MEKIEDYTLIEKIGEGASCKVYLAKKKYSDKLFAVKKYSKEITNALKLRNHIRDEINILGNLKHENIINMEKLILINDNYYIIMEYANGGTLSKCFKEYYNKRKKSFSEEIVQYIMKQIVAALIYIHDKNIIHRDLKLENIMVNFDSDNDKQDLNMMKSKIKLIDFGISKQLASSDGLASSIVGTATYMDPNILDIYLKTQNNTGNINYKSITYGKEVDIWSLGCICYLLLTGKSIFEDIDMNNLLEQKQYKVSSKLSEEALDFLTCMFQIDGSRRPTAHQLKEHKFLTNDFSSFKNLQIENLKKSKKLAYIKDSIQLYKQKMKKKKEKEEEEKKKKYLKYNSFDDINNKNLKEVNNKNNNIKEPANFNIFNNAVSFYGQSMNGKQHPQIINPNDGLNRHNSDIINGNDLLNQNNHGQYNSGNINTFNSVINRANSSNIYQFNSILKHRNSDNMIGNNLGLNHRNSENIYTSNNRSQINNVTNPIINYAFNNY